VSELELRLEALGRELDLPAPPPDLTAGVLRRIAEPAPAPFWRRRALLVAVAAAAVVAVGAVLAVPPARSAVFDFFGIGSAEIRIVDELPEVESGPLDLGDQTSLAAVRAREPELLEPSGDEVGEPDAVFVASSKPGAPVTFVWGDPERPRLLLTQVRGSYHFEKLVAGNQGEITLTEVNGEDAAWIEGKPHVVFYENEQGGADLPGRLARNTLVWSRGPVTLRLEGDLSREQAERIARGTR
jgi:hypothetical protein